MAKKKSEEYADSGDENDYTEEPNFEDEPGFVDDITDEGKLGSLRVLPARHGISSQTKVT